MLYWVTSCFHLEDGPVEPEVEFVQQPVVGHPETAPLGKLQHEPLLFFFKNSTPPTSFLNFNTISLFFQILYPGAITWRRCSVMFVPLDVCDLGATWASFRRGTFFWRLRRRQYLRFRYGDKLDFFWRLRRRQYLRCQEVWYSQHKRHNWGEIKSDLCCWNQIDDYDDSMIYVIWMQRFYIQHQIQSNISKLVF